MQVVRRGLTKLRDNVLSRDESQELVIDGHLGRLDWILEIHDEVRPEAENGSGRGSRQRKSPLMEICQSLRRRRSDVLRLREIEDELVARLELSISDRKSHHILLFGR
jgi:hypothetical protein